jgi:hypothetical protein
MQADLCPQLILCCRYRIASSEVDDLFNIVNQAVKHPLNIDLDLTSHGKPIHSLACTNIAEDRFYNPQPFAVSTASLWCVDLLLHFIGNAARTVPIEHMHLSRYRSGVTQTFGTQLAITARRLRRLVRYGVKSLFFKTTLLQTNIQE